MIQDTKMASEFPVSQDFEIILDSFSVFKECKVMIIGDIILDEFVYGNVERISPEAPVPVVEVERETFLLGGAANVLNNIISLEGQTFLYGVVGHDDAGEKVFRLLKERKCSTSGIIKDKERRTTIKTRVIANKQQVVRFDKENRSPISRTTLEELKVRIGDNVSSIDLIIISDYGKGVITEDLMSFLRKISQQHHKDLLVDPKIKNVQLYKGATYITPNHKEAENMTGIKIKDNESLCQAGNLLMKMLGCKAVIITRGEKGMSIFENSGRVTDIPAVAREVYDVTGAGDTVIGVMGLGLAANLSLLQSAFLANVAAGIVVGEVGTAAVSSSKLKRALQTYSRDISSINGCINQYSYLQVEQ
ncbi:MAG: D-glycero-beta-D-manno-heptose-7-phosphate kinase [Deltaproteobacteria bacterium]|nr:MAG: D-glycero-beta-D-manno-heptose-7-phosphate kinase [Deltaproteobacteria bacterium]